MPNRIIKESICTSDTLDQLSVEEERFFYRLLVQADDFGRFDGRAPVVLAGCFPLRAHEISLSKVEGWLQALADVDIIRFYYVDGRRYLQFTTWDKHQQKRAKHSKYPDPPADWEHVISDDIRRESSDSKCPREARSENTRSEKREAGRVRERAREDGTPSIHPDPHPAAADPIMDDSVTPERYYEQTISVISPMAVDIISQALAKGLHPSAVKWGIREFSLSNGKTPKYLARILDRLARDRLLTAEQAEAAQARDKPRGDPSEDLETRIARIAREMEVASP